MTRFVAVLAAMIGCPVAFGADFDEVSLVIQSQGVYWQPTQTIRIRGNGTCGYRVEERPGRGQVPTWEPAYLEHRLPAERLGRLEQLLAKTDWLTAAVQKEGQTPHPHAPKLTLSLSRKGAAPTLTLAAYVTLTGQGDETYGPLLKFFWGIAAQEHLVYRLERLPGREREDACREIGEFVQAEQGGPYGKPTYEIDLRRFLPMFQRHVRQSFSHSTEELIPAVRLLGHFRSEDDRQYIADLAHDRDLRVRSVVAEALGRMGGPESVAVLRKMLRSTHQEAGWQLVRIAPVDTIVSIIESGQNPHDERDPTFLDYEWIIRAYLDHWKDVPKPIDPRVVDAVRKSMTVTKVREFRTQYHKEFLAQVEADR
jgi:hypothetical protein